MFVVHEIEDKKGSCEDNFLSEMELSGERSIVSSGFDSCVNTLIPH